jgi:hypothetical protein
MKLPATNHLIPFTVGFVGSYLLLSTFKKQVNALAGTILPTATKTVNFSGVNNIAPTSVKKWGDDVTLLGTGRDSTILRASATGQSLLDLTGIKSLTIKNLTLDGNYKVQHCANGIGDFSITMENVRIMRGIHICAVFDAGKGAVVRNSIYEKGGKNADLQAFGGQGGVLFENNYMDRRQSLGPGSCLTFGEGKNITVKNNTMIGINQSWGISIEAWGHPGGYNNVLIQNNHLINAKLVIGGAFINTSYTTPINNVKVLNNVIENGVIEVNGPEPNGQFAKIHGVPNAGLGYNQVNNLVIKGNQVPKITKVGMLKNVDIQSV